MEEECGVRNGPNRYVGNGLDVIDDGLPVIQTLCIDGEIPDHVAARRRDDVHRRHVAARFPNGGSDFSKHARVVRILTPNGEAVGNAWTWTGH